MHAINKMLFSKTISRTTMWKYVSHSYGYEDTSLISANKAASLMMQKKKKKGLMQN